MNTLTPTNTNSIRRGFTLIEILIVVVILGILAAVVVPQFTNASDDANDAAVRSQLQTLRGQIELYRAQVGSDPAMLTTGWADMIEGDYLMVEPNNPLTADLTAASIAAAAADGVGVSVFIRFFPLKQSDMDCVDWGDLIKITAISNLGIPQPS